MSREISQDEWRSARVPADIARMQDRAGEVAHTLVVQVQLQLAADAIAGDFDRVDRFQGFAASRLARAHFHAGFLSQPHCHVCNG
jgi:hypothetical protein